VPGADRGADHGEVGHRRDLVQQDNLCPGRRRAARLNPSRLPAPLPALVLQVIIANNIDETNTRMLESMEVGQ
jgi:hypothetical protein